MERLMKILHRRSILPIDETPVARLDLGKGKPNVYLAKKYPRKSSRLALALYPCYGCIMDIMCIQKANTMTMHVNLSPEMEGFIKSKVSGGFYGNATEVIRDAIRRMQAEESRIAAWHAAIAKGDEQLNRGEGIAYTPEALKDITDSAIGAMHSSKPMEADVLP
jgi:antitoxin ParD1/3/4